MGAEVKARIAVDSDDALKRIEEINKQSGYTSESMSKLAKSVAEVNKTLKEGQNSLDVKSFKQINEQLERQSLAFKLVDDKTKAAAQSASLYRNAIISLTKSGSLTKEQTDDLVRTYNTYKTAASSAAAATQTFKVAQDGLGKSSGNTGLKLLQVAKNILKFQLLMAPITAAVRGVRNTISDSIKVAAEAEQVFSKLGTVFAGVEQSATSTAKALASSLGVAGSTASSALSTVGDLLQAQGMGTIESLGTASEWTSKFQDIIAFKDINMTLEEFAQTFMSGAAGNLRNFRTFGSVVKESAVNARLAAEGLDKLTGSELELAKMTARAEMALEQQANAMGATEREWETMLSVSRRLSEAWKEYKENLGDALNRFVKPARAWLAELLDYTNDVTRALKEIDGGEYTVKVVQETTDEYLKRIVGVMVGVSSANPFTGKTGNRFTAWLDSMLPAVLAQGGASISMQMDAAKQIADAKVFSAEEVASIIRSTGATNQQVMEAAEMGGFTITEDVLEGARKLVVEYENLQKAMEDTKMELLSSAEAYDSFTESLALLPHLDMASSEYTATVEMADGNFMEDISEGWADGMQIAVRQAIRQMGNLGTDSFIDDIDKVFGTGDKAKAYQSWLNEIKDLYTILYNRQKKFGDVSDETLTTVINLWGRVNGQLDAYQRGLNAQTAYSGGLSSLQSSTLSYQRQLELVGLDDFDSQVKQLGYTFEDMKAQFAELSEEELADLEIDLSILDKEFTLQIEAYRKLYDAQMAYEKRITAQSTGRSLIAGYQESIEKAVFVQNKIGKDLRFNLSDDRNVIFKNVNSEQAGIIYDYQKAVKDMTATLKDVPFTIDESGRKLYDFGEGIHLTASQVSDTLYDYFIPKIEDAADAADDFAEKAKDAWKAVGNRALGSAGTLGGVIQSFQGEGDIWSKIVNAVLTILENTESWPEIAATLDSIFEMFEPVTESLLDLIMTLPWKDIIFMLKVIASAITIISAVIQGINVLVNWLWDNIKIAIKNVATDVYNLFHPNRKREKDEYIAFEVMTDQLAEISFKTQEYLDRIWSANEDIVRNTAKGDDYAKQLALLKDLYQGGALNLSEYSGAVAKVTGSPMGRIESYSGTSYATGSGGTTYFSGDIVINGYNGDPRELALEIERILTRRQQAGATTFA